MRRPVFFLSFAAATSATAVARPVLTQGPPPGTVPGTSWSDTAVAESLKVLDQLNKTAERNNRNAAFWMRRAVVAWGLAYRDRVGPDYKGLDWTRLGRLADSSIRIALSIAPNDARVALTAAQFYLSSGQTAVRAQAPRHIERALKIARAGKDTAVLLDALIEQGRTFWRSYDTFANRRVEPEPGAFERTLATDSIMSPATRAAHNGGSMLPAFSSSVVERLNGATMPLGGDFGGSAYTQAEALFREAYKVAPADARAFHELAMLLTEHKRWQELANLARDRTRRVPKDASGWLALGLAMQRLKRFPVAAASFDTALTFLDARERAHFTSLRRVLPTQEEAVFDSMSSAEQARQAARYWRFADPLWSRGSSDAYVEFLARATYADLRWSVEELGVRGIDSDRGQMHVRYGPPDVEAVLGPN
ncbi:MAG TPA: GWxTD domain-containing protein, partial [Gemmatimonadaceae bacterium]|nr:GWxTD domain-containing protein [Gemmatimonadaceae bacterium]